MEYYKTLLHEKESWIIWIKQLRKAYYYINYYSVHRAFSFIQLLLKGAKAPGIYPEMTNDTKEIQDGEFIEKFKEYICVINPFLVQQYSQISKYASLFYFKWNEIMNSLTENDTPLLTSVQSLAPMSSIGHQEDTLNNDVTSASIKSISRKHLVALSMTMDILFPEITPLPRPLHINHIDKYVITDKIPTGIHIAVCPTLHDQYTQLLSLCAIQQQLPAWNSCFICTKSTTLEELSNFLYRWSTSHIYLPTSTTTTATVTLEDDIMAVDSGATVSSSVQYTTFYIVEIDKASYQVQHEMMSLIREILATHTDSETTTDTTNNKRTHTNQKVIKGDNVESGKVTIKTRNPLIFIGDSHGSNYLSAQFQHVKLNTGLLSMDMLQTISKSLHTYNTYIYNYTSRNSGSGKSFQIRLRAYQEQRMYVHVPINSKSVTASSLIELIHTNMNRSLMTDKEKTTNTTNTMSSALSGTNETMKVLLHFDLSSTVSADIVNFIFHLTYLNILESSSTNTLYYHPYTDMCICIELAPNIHLYPLRQLLCYPTIEMTVTENLFSLDPYHLLHGMSYEFNAQLYGNLSSTTSLTTTNSIVNITTSGIPMAVNTEDQSEEDMCPCKYSNIIPLNDGNMINIQQSHAYTRLYTVCTVLYTLHKHDGTFPYDFNLYEIFVDSFLMKPLPIEKSLAYNLLLQAIGHTEVNSTTTNTTTQNNNNNNNNNSVISLPSSMFSSSSSSISLWCVWSFINLFYWQIIDMHHTASPIYLSCLPDIHIQLMTFEYDQAMKERMKGEFIKYMMTTSASFATKPQSNQVIHDKNTIIGVIVRNLSWIAESRGKELQYLFWKRESYDNDGYTVYRSPSFNMNKKSCIYYLHYRESEARWVIDDTVNYTGGVIAYSQNNKPLHECIFEKRELNGRTVPVKSFKMEHKDGYNNEAISITGFEKCMQGLGSLAGPDDNGIYLRVSDDINGQPHYIKSTEPIRHLYYLIKDNATRWVIAKTCNAEVMGAIAYTRNDQILTQSYIYYPPNKVEDTASFHMVTAGNAMEIFTDLWHKLQDNNNDANEEGLNDFIRENEILPPSMTTIVSTTANSSNSSNSNSSSNANSMEIMDSTMSQQVSIIQDMSSFSLDKIQAMLEQDNLHVELVKWKDSNHEYIIFNNQHSVVYFLSIDATKLQNHMHPILVKYLESNHIRVGESIFHTTDDNTFWEILSSVTGIHRSREDILKIFNTNFCLTGDTLFKILAIIYRIKCKIPIILLGECGCGKTMLLQFLCHWLNVELLSLNVHGGTTEEDIIHTFDKAKKILIHGIISKVSNDSTTNTMEITQIKKVDTVFIFFDEVNTCSHMGLLNESICHRTVYGDRLLDGIQIIAAMNPYRLRKKRNEENIGLSYHDTTTTTTTTAVHTPPVNPVTQETTTTAGTSNVTTTANTAITNKNKVKAPTKNHSYTSVVEIDDVSGDEASHSKTANLHPSGTTNNSIIPLISTTSSNNLSQLVYRVYPIPPTLKDFIFDYGSLDSATELLYIQSMVIHDSTIQSILSKYYQTYTDILPSANSPTTTSTTKDSKKTTSSSTTTTTTTTTGTSQDKSTTSSTSTTTEKKAINVTMREQDNQFISHYIQQCQLYVRDIENDASVVSLRDVKRCLDLFIWFYTHVPTTVDIDTNNSFVLCEVNGEVKRMNKIAYAFVLSLAHIYYYRLPSNKDRAGIWTFITTTVTTITTATENTSDKPDIVSSSMRPITDTVMIDKVIHHAQMEIIHNLVVDDGICFNQALTENVYVTIICILNKIPIFLVGKPGTSKTLTMQIIQNNLKGKQSVKPFWKDKPSVHVFTYQCSPLSTTKAIKHIYESAKTFQTYSSDTLTVLLLDEVGLAEYSPDLPLKIFHYILIEPCIAIVGLSNWVLDSSKMNRAICLQRSEPTCEDIITTGYTILSTTTITTTAIPTEPTSTTANANTTTTSSTNITTTTTTTTAATSKNTKTKASNTILGTISRALRSTSASITTTPTPTNTTNSVNTTTTSSNISTQIPTVTVSLSSVDLKKENIITKAPKWLHDLSRIYLYIYENQKYLLHLSRDFIGMRDFYSLLKYIKVHHMNDISDISKTTKTKTTKTDKSLEVNKKNDCILNDIISPDLLVKAVCRNFNGHQQSIDILLPLFYDAIFDLSHLSSSLTTTTATTTTTGTASVFDSTHTPIMTKAKRRPSKRQKAKESSTNIEENTPMISICDTNSAVSIVHPCMTYVPNTIDLIRENIHSTDNIRNLMILTNTMNILYLLHGSSLFDQLSVTILFGSTFSEDKTSDIYILQQLNLIKHCMKEGKTVILLYNENIYESLYDILNQRYIKQIDTKTHIEKQFLRLAIGSKSQLCPVSKGFKIILINEQIKAYTTLDLPLLNRFEKQILQPYDLIKMSPFALQLMEKLHAFCHSILQETGITHMSSLICGYYDDTLTSLVLALTQYGQLPVLNEMKTSTNAAERESTLLNEIYERGIYTLLKSMSLVAILYSKTLHYWIQHFTTLSHKRGGQYLNTTACSAVKSNSNPYIHVDNKLESIQDEYLSLRTQLFPYLYQVMQSDTIPTTGTTPNTTTITTITTTSNSSQVHESTNMDNTITSDLIILLTRSPVSHYETYLMKWIQDIHSKHTCQKMDTNTSKIHDNSSENDTRTHWIHKLTIDDTITIELSHITSEAVIKDIIDDFYFHSSNSTLQSDDRVKKSKSPILLTILCDPLYCHTSQIYHTQHLLLQAYKRYKMMISTIQNTNVDRLGPKQVLFLIHLPTGITSRSRQYTLDYYPPWTHLYIDDILTTSLSTHTTENDIQKKEQKEQKVQKELNLLILLKMNLYDLCHQQYLSLSKLILQNYQKALAKCTFLPVTNIHDSKYLTDNNITYVKVFQTLLHYPEFLDYITECCLQCLQTLRPIQGIQYHIYNACNHLCGSLQQSIDICIHRIISNTLAFVIKQIDVNYNILWVFQYTQYMSIWLPLMSQYHSSISISRVCLDDLYQPTTPIIMKNTGLHGPFLCHFPLSDKVMSLLSESKWLQLIQQFGPNQIGTILKSTHMLLQSSLGKDLMLAIYTNILSNHPTAYLHDFVYSTVYSFQYLSYEFQYDFIHVYLDLFQWNDLNTALYSIEFFSTLITTITTTTTTTDISSSKSLLDVNECCDHMNIADDTSHTSTQNMLSNHLEDNTFAYLPEVVYVKYWYIEQNNRFLTIFTIMNAIKVCIKRYTQYLFLPDTFDYQLIDILLKSHDKTASTSLSTTAKSGNECHNLQYIDTIILNYLLNLLLLTKENAYEHWNEAVSQSSEDSIHYLSAWLELFSSIQKELQLLLQLTVFSSEQLSTLNNITTTSRSSSISDEHSTDSILNKWWILQSFYTLIQEYIWHCNAATTHYLTTSTTTTSTNTASKDTVKVTNAVALKIVKNNQEITYKAKLSTQHSLLQTVYSKYYNQASYSPYDVHTITTLVTSLKSYPNYLPYYVYSFVKHFIMKECSFMKQITKINNSTILEANTSITSTHTTLGNTTTDSSTNTLYNTWVSMTYISIDVLLYLLTLVRPFTSFDHIKEYKCIMNVLHRLIIDIAYQYINAGIYNLEINGYFTTICHPSSTYSSSEIMYLFQLYYEAIENHATYIPHHSNTEDHGTMTRSSSDDNVILTMEYNTLEIQAVLKDIYTIQSEQDFYQVFCKYQLKLFNILVYIKYHIHTYAMSIYNLVTKSTKRSQDTNDNSIKFSNPECRLSNADVYDWTYPPPSHICELAFNTLEECKIYMLAILFANGGKRTLLRYLRHQSVPCLPHSCTLLSKNAPALRYMDPFSSLVTQDSYMMTCEVITNYYDSQEIDRLDNWHLIVKEQISDDKDCLHLLLASIFTQLTLSYDTITVTDTIIDIIATKVQSLFSLYFNQSFPTSLISNIVQSISSAITIPTTTATTTSSTSTTAATATTTATTSPDTILSSIYLSFLSYLLQYLPTYLRQQHEHWDDYHMLLLNLQIHIILLAINPHSGWIYTLFTNLSNAKNMYIPGMVDSEMAVIIGVTRQRSSEFTSWYECPNGHKYTVGNCGRPMEISTCPQCNTRIGGTNHTMIGNNRIVHNSQLDVSIKGYTTDSCGQENGYDVIRIQKHTTAIFRIMIHMVLLTHLQIHYRNTENIPTNSPIIQFFYSDRQYDSGSIVSYQHIYELLFTRIHNDWKMLKHTLSLQDEDIAMGIHIIIGKIEKNKKYANDMSRVGLGRSDYEYAMHIDQQQRGINNDLDRREVLKMPPANMSSIARLNFEVEFEERIVNPIFVDLSGKKLIQETKAKFESDKLDLLLLQLLHSYAPFILRTTSILPPTISTTSTTTTASSNNKNNQSSTTTAAATATTTTTTTTISSTDVSTHSIIPISSYNTIINIPNNIHTYILPFYRPRDLITYKEFERIFYLQTTHQTTYPLLTTLLQSHSKLFYIKYIIPILSWHAIIFRVYKPKTITREQASLYTNQDVITQLPFEEQVHAREVLVQYCEAFNTCLKLPGNLRECAENVFLNKETGEVDLSCGQRYASVTSPSILTPPPPSLLHETSDDSSTLDSISNIHISMDIASHDYITTVTTNNTTSTSAVTNNTEIHSNKKQKRHHSVKSTTATSTTTSTATATTSATTNTGTMMSPSTPIIYSLPNSLKVNNEFKDPRSLCTIFILDQLQRIQEEIMESLENTVNNAVTTAAATTTATTTTSNTSTTASNRVKTSQYTTQSSSAHTTSNSHANITNTATTTSTATVARVNKQSVPSTSYLTPTTLIQKRLIDYDFYQVLLPLIQIHYQQELDYDHGSLQGFNYDFIEKELKQYFHSYTSQPLLIAIIEYEFQGELTLTGGYSSFQQKFKQSPISESLLDQIWIDIDNEHNYTILLQYIDNCISFLNQQYIVSTIQIDMKLSTFITDILMMDKQEWIQICGPTIHQHILLKHLKSLKDGLYEKQHQGTLFANLPIQYRKALTDEYKQFIDILYQHCTNKTLLLQVMKEFIMKLQLTEFTFDEFIYYNLPYIGDTNIDDMDWYQNYFPQQITIDYAYNMYLYLKNKQ